MRNLALLLLTVLIAMPGARAGMVDIPGAGSGSFNFKTMSMKERQFRYTERQQYDFSCGSAALATLLTHHYGDPVNEEAVYTAMWEQGDQDKIRKEGFSMLDMKNFLASRGYEAEGYKASLDKLAKAGISAIVLIRDGRYNHFVVIKGIRDGKVAFGDPAQGARVMGRAEFERMMINRILFVIKGHNTNVVFNHPKDWRIREKAPVGLASGPGDLANVTLMRRPSGDF
ncbi:MAG: C39 family peptidase [Thiobacillus sp.]|nr:C39 family peptidase [Thiobacillus sp.]